MDEQSIWKKEISFGRKKAPKAPPEPGEERTSIWKKEIGFKKKSKAEQTEKPKTAAQSPAEPKQSIWKKEISFGKKAKAEAPAAQPPVGDSGPGEGVRGDREASPATTETPTQPITVAPEALAAPPAPVVPEPASAEATPAPVVINEALELARLPQAQAQASLQRLLEQAREPVAAAT